MSYLTVEVEIDDGRIIPREPEKLPEKGSGLLTILEPSGAAPTSGRPRNGPPRPYALARGQFRVPADFNAPLPEEVLRAFDAT